MRDEARQDILLKPHASEIRRQALLYVFEVQARLTRQPMDLNQFCSDKGISYPEEALKEVNQNMTSQGLIVTEADETILKIEGN